MGALPIPYPPLLEPSYIPFLGFKFQRHRAISGCHCAIEIIQSNVLSKIYYHVRAAGYRTRGRSLAMVAKDLLVRISFFREWCCTYLRPFLEWRVSLSIVLNRFVVYLTRFEHGPITLLSHESRKNFGVQEKPPTVKWCSLFASAEQDVAGCNSGPRSTWAPDDRKRVGT